MVLSCWLEAKLLQRRAPSVEKQMVLSCWLEVKPLQRRAFLRVIKPGQMEGKLTDQAMLLLKTRLPPMSVLPCHWTKYRLIKSLWCQLVREGENSLLRQMS